MKVVFIRGCVECLPCAGAVLGTIDEEINEANISTLKIVRF